MPRPPKAKSAAARHKVEVGFAAEYEGFVLAHGCMSANQPGNCPARSALSTPKAKPQSLPRQRDIRRALIEADLVDTALRESVFPQGEATPQVVNVAKNNMVALPGQLFYSTQITLAKNKAADAKRGFCDRGKQAISIMDSNQFTPFALAA